MDNKIIIFMTTIQYPCGEDAKCCGSVGQKDEEIADLKNTIEGSFTCTVEIVDVKNRNSKKGHKQADKLIKSFGLGILPLVTLNDEVVSMGTLNEKEIHEQLSLKLKCE